jgi:type II secretion system protein H
MRHGLHMRDGLPVAGVSRDVRGCRRGRVLKASGGAVRFSARGFTLIELILVMALLLIVMAVAAPAFKPFFQARDLDGEARRLLSLAQYGQSRAVSEGIPVDLWLDARERRYGLSAAPGYLDAVEDLRAVEYRMAERLEMEVMLPLTGRSDMWQAMPRGMTNATTIRFLPDGFVAETSPWGVKISPQGGDPVWINLSSNRLRYAIERREPDLFALQNPRGVYPR